ncbi:serine hydrolase domain-containing protein [Pseudogracilibacillus auburnensis]|uniref:Beta-lactamase n=1 Tax=Pseudogracilibacillus auburnensis TaxID=1494959 RepID=A0A2V3W2E5_9BACI|nr:serine hydrolase domain-containing protein [Pseudogracilibacillus auburnensis]PXW87364.1 CubicO group peptidase (beta-lactamase class C family) [Pseudogracilibacillus auburnensis]
MKNRIESLLESKLHRENEKILLGIINQNGRELYSVGLDKHSNVAMEDKIFEIGSISKVFTAVLLQTMVRDNIIQLDEPIVHYNPEYQRAFGKDMTLRNLVTHTSNLPREASNLKVKDRMNPYASYESKDLEHFLLNHKLRRTKQKWKYSNVGYGFLGNLLTELIGKNFEDTIRDRICKPLHMNNTFIHINDEHEDKLIKSYQKKKEIPPLSIPSLAGAGALRSTMHDMFLFLEANLGLLNTPLLQDFNLTHKKQHKINKNTHMGLGWIISQDKETGEIIHWHTGGSVGFNTYIGIKKEKQLGIIVATTKKHSLFKLIRVFLGFGQLVQEDIANGVYKVLAPQS